MEKDSPTKPHQQNGTNNLELATEKSPSGTKAPLLANHQNKGRDKKQKVNQDSKPATGRYGLDLIL